MDCKGVIVGLGNPGSKYENTRHNIGFMLVDHLVSLAAERKSMRLEKFDESGDYELWRCKFAGAYRLLVKPMTYMNLSGKAVSKICGRHGVQPDEIVVVHDELDLPIGRMKFKMGGGNNGHNGLESIQERLGTPNFHRLRLGVGRPQDQYKVISDWVLEPFDDKGVAVLPEIIQHATKGLDIFFRRGAGFAQQHVNSFCLPEDEAE
ncbi:MULTISPECIES: aminoacyl-tRNA hydrolase [unclassified Pseudodesulfovibrio]|uniref:aminoacyl-tRNA hydrolase n=1 Tax=unclassified Pseudodesulfovibrio TaxID=2661612 RepID=UPI000FEBE6A5|nr:MULTISPECIES: aminoacyl-tRNA hydrolase [unclassified Pseudodesulfovibrio]MCJ2164613.1 aminoacyl-tRNA hydrolase [Pseudodesulfovibrio sp. S3-i]RWU04193.1 aminoacyl-tRNA hydrolase [Pseudodesulfovibrio sp. S3]